MFKSNCKEHSFSTTLMQHYAFGKGVIMASIFRRKFKTKHTYVVQVRRKGFKTLVKSFNTRTDAQNKIKVQKVLDKDKPAN